MNVKLSTCFSTITIASKGSSSWYQPSHVQSFWLWSARGGAGWAFGFKPWAYRGRYTEQDVERQRLGRSLWCKRDSCVAAYRWIQVLEHITAVSATLVGSLTLVAELPKLQGVEKSNQQSTGVKPGVEKDRCQNLQMGNPKLRCQLS